MEQHDIYFLFKKLSNNTSNETVIYYTVYTYMSQHIFVQEAPTCT